MAAAPDFKCRGGAVSGLSFVEPAGLPTLPLCVCLNGCFLCLLRLSFPSFARVTACWQLPCLFCPAFSSVLQHIGSFPQSLVSGSLNLYLYPLLIDLWHQEAKKNTCAPAPLAPLHLLPPPPNLSRFEARFAPRGVLTDLAANFFTPPFQPPLFCHTRPAPTPTPRPPRRFAFGDCSRPPASLWRRLLVSVSLSYKYTYNTLPPVPPLFPPPSSALPPPCTAARAPGLRAPPPPGGASLVVSKAPREAHNQNTHPFPYRLHHPPCLPPPPTPYRTQFVHNSAPPRPTPSSAAPSCAGSLLHRVVSRPPPTTPFWLLLLHPRHHRFLPALPSLSAFLSPMASSPFGTLAPTAPSSTHHNTPGTPPPAAEARTTAFRTSRNARHPPPATPPPSLRPPAPSPEPTPWPASPLQPPLGRSPMCLVLFLAQPPLPCCMPRTLNAPPSSSRSLPAAPSQPRRGAKRLAAALPLFYAAPCLAAVFFGAAASRSPAPPPKRGVAAVATARAGLLRSDAAASEEEDRSHANLCLCLPFLNAPLRPQMSAPLFFPSVSCPGLCLLFGLVCPLLI